MSPYIRQKKSSLYNNVPSQPQFIGYCFANVAVAFKRQIAITLCNKSSSDRQSVFVSSDLSYCRCHRSCKAKNIPKQAEKS